MPTPPRRPNILFLMSDEHRADVAGYAGNAVVRTPNLDALAATGTVFRNAYTPSPICIPARQCLMAGQLPRTCGCERFGDDLAPGYRTFARHFAAHGYETVCYGKLHHLGTDQMQGWTHRGAGDLTLDRRYIARDPDADLPSPPPFRKWSDAKEVLRAGVGEGPCQINDRYWTDGAKAYVRERFLSPSYDRWDTDTPLLLKLSLTQPHYPYFTDAEKFAYYLNRVQPFENEPVFDHPFLSQRQVTPGVDGVTGRDLRRATAAYYGMIETMDSLLGALMAQLTIAGQDLDDWIIVYTSDHGEMLGEHGIWEKQKFFEASVRVPLILRWPRRFAQPRGVTENISLCDLFATLCDLAYLPIPPDLDSRSVVPLLEGSGAEWDDEIVSQFAGRNLLIKQGSLKYQWYGPDLPEVLFDLMVDPGENRNLLDLPEYDHLLARFRTRRAALGF